MSSDRVRLPTVVLLEICVAVDLTFFNVCSRPLLTTFFEFYLQDFSTVFNQKPVSDLSLEPCLCFCDIRLHFGIFDLEKKVSTNNNVNNSLSFKKRITF